jgi:hypothetical protein
MPIKVVLNIDRKKFPKWFIHKKKKANVSGWHAEMAMILDFSCDVCLIAKSSKKESTKRSELVMYLQEKH